MAPKSDKEKKVGKTNTGAGKPAPKKESSKPKKEEEVDDEDDLDEEMDEDAPAAKKGGKAAASTKKKKDEECRVCKAAAGIDNPPATETVCSDQAEQDFRNKHGGQVVTCQ